ncbi:ATP-dependent DNA helicase [Demequina sp. SYSU T00039]|uniref:DNA 3'-5' helicase n=1 Tax=Demequina lignilytica TaxID=3051663 RepID=A0AAW7M9W2_9MICO|nr:MULTISPECIES: ATP-dependent DNA helicase [unclassified Demequina]MDN4478233.1 ATP-dependent DNA helicase [Demequina sp. SYSU T00039-1]MDN4488317.1 ATP-dependent DNA helicase [Demequina sp. SYSU T00039]MDN4490136.1 ATP-dependent DNA helicase [Demequina sp. SYSU T00068]
MTAQDPVEDGTVRGRARTAAELMALVDPDISVTAEQARVIEAGLEPMLVVAGAGSGKTATLSMRIVALLDHAERLFGTPIAPDEILCLTFTRKAAAEIAERAERRIATVFGADAGRPPVAVSTYNAYAAQLVAEHGLRLGIDPDAATLTQAALWQLADDVVGSWTEDLDVDAALSTLTAAIPRLAGQLRDHESTPAELRSWAREAIAWIEALPGKGDDTVPGPLVTRNGTPNAHAKSLTRFRTLAGMADLVAEFQRRKRAASQLDFADQVGFAVDLSRLPAVRAIERGRYRAILLDEFQDTSPGQLRLFARLFGRSHHVMAVGDPHQAIYGFRGASESALPMFVEEFGGPGEVQVASLSVSWRNERAVLDVANAAARPLRESSRVHVDPLRSRGEELGRPEPTRRAPAVASLVAEDHVVEASRMVEWLKARLAELTDDEATATAAVLCRRKAQFTPVVEALAAAGLDYEVVGLGGLVDTPEVADLVALLEVAHDPSRGDSAMRLLTSERMALGIRDLAALHDWAEELAGPREQRETEAGIVDAIASPPPPGWRSRHGRELGVVARARLVALHHAIDAIRTRTYLPLGELILTAERAWGLDIEAAVARPDGRAARNVDAFIDAARQFAAGADHVTLGAFLAWLDAARGEESGLELPVKEPEPGAVQVLTVHASKGLEWDVVAVPGLVDGHFPSVDAPTPTRDWYSDGGWYSGRGLELPYELRLDRDDLPLWEWREAIDQQTFAASIGEFKRECGSHRVEEERRLFYVAVTRARSHVLLSASWFTDGVKPRRPSSYLEELVEAGLIDTSAWAPAPADDARNERHAPPETWPRPPTPAQLARRELAGRVERIRASGDPSPAWAALPSGAQVEAMLTERAQRRAGAGDVRTPAHLSTSALVSIRRDREAFAAQLRRPLPSEPTDAARRGSLIHAWIESRYGHTPLIELADLGPGEDDDAIEELKAAFEASPWRLRTPSHIEVDVEVPLAGVTVRSRIDAVFPPGDGLERVTVVDWKSGAPPRDPAERAAREVQLSVYRLAWATYTGAALEDVDAAFHYVRDGRTVFPEQLLSRDQIEGLIRGRS